MWSSSKNLNIPGLYELDGQSQTRRQVCHCWELQDEPFAFCGQIGTAYVDLLNTVFSMHLIGFLLLVTKQERRSALKRLRYYVSWDTQDSVFCKFSNLWVVFTSDESRNTRIDTLIGKAMSFIAPWWRNGCFQRTQIFQFLNRSLLRSSPVVMNHTWGLKEYCQKNKGRDGVFAKSSRCDTALRQRPQVWNPKPEMSSHFSESRDPQLW